MKKRNRTLYSLLILVTMLMGMASRKYPSYFPYFLAEYLGDTLWALLVFWLIGFLFVEKRSKTIMAGALAFSFVIEISQLYHSPWIETIRQTTPGSLVLGHGFLWTDLICYTTGILTGYLLEIGILLRKRKKTLSAVE